MNATSGTLTLAVVIIGLASFCGCGQAVSEGAGFVMGADGTFVTVRPSTTGLTYFLADYTQFELGGFRDDTGGHIPASFMGYLPGKFREELADAGLPNYAGKTLVLRGTVLLYEGEGFVGKIIGPIEQVIVRAEMVDKETGAVLTTANVIGRTTNRINLGVEAKAEGLAKGLIAWIEEYRPDSD